MAKRTKAVEKTAQKENPQVEEQVNEKKSDDAQANEAAAEEKNAEELQDLKVREFVEVPKVVNEPATQETDSTPCISVVFPYFRENNPSKGLLKLATAAYKRFLIPPANIVVIGDREDWMGEEITVIEYDADLAGKYSEVDMIIQAITCDSVASSFIWAKPHTYPVSPLLFGDLVLPKYQSKSSGFCVRKEECDFNTPLPVYFEKESLVSMLEKYPELQHGEVDVINAFSEFVIPDGYVPIKLDWKTDCWYLPVVSEKPNEAALNDFLKHKKFITHNATAATKWLYNKISDIINDAR